MLKMRAFSIFDIFSFRRVCTTHRLGLRAILFASSGSLGPKSRILRLCSATTAGQFFEALLLGWAGLWHYNKEAVCTAHPMRSWGLSDR
jgi:hypothetical protein